MVKEAPSTKSRRHMTRLHTL